MIVEGLMNSLDLADRIESHYRTRLRIKTSERVVARYQALPVGDRIMVVESRHGVDAPVVTGRLRPLKDDLRRETLEPLLNEAPDLRGRIHPWMLVQDGPVTMEGAWFILPMLMVPGLVAAMLGGAYSRWPGQHPAARRLSRFGRWDDVASRVDEDVQDHGIRLEGGRFLVSPRWVVAGLQVLRVGDLVCVRRDRPLRKRDPATVVLYTAAESTPRLYLPVEDARTLLRSIQAAAAWVLVGGPEVTASWGRDRKALVDLIGEHRKAILGQQATTSDAPPQASEPVTPGDRVPSAWVAARPAGAPPAELPVDLGRDDLQVMHLQSGDFRAGLAGIQHGARTARPACRA